MGSFPERYIPTRTLRRAVIASFERAGTFIKPNEGNYQ
jgi:hypothetical protein